MKVCGFVGSPRKQGNSDILVERFLEGAAASQAVTKKFFLADLNINQCRGCYANCMFQPGFRCAVFRDDMDMLMDEIASGDLFIFASPLYCSCYSAIMARFFERLLPFWHVEPGDGEPGTPGAFRFLNNPAKGKKAVIALVQDLKDPAVGKLALDIFEHNVAKTYMMDIAGRLQVTDVRSRGDIVKKLTVLQDVFNMGKKLAEDS
ncbi:MAG: flavodoxin family protein [Deltaproteobacteria bacterium]|nr:flavodoxin family protein [Deltaproteobacteria bacterium]